MAQISLTHQIYHAIIVQMLLSLTHVTSMRVRPKEPG